MDNKQEAALFEGQIRKLLTQSYLLDDFQLLIQLTRSEQILQQHHGVIGLLSISIFLHQQSQEAVNFLINEGLVPILCQFITHNQYPILKSKALQLLMYISRWQTHCLIEANFFPTILSILRQKSQPPTLLNHTIQSIHQKYSLADLSSSKEGDINNSIDAAWTLGNMIATDNQFWSSVLELDAIEILLSIAEHQINTKLSKPVVWILCLLIRKNKKSQQKEKKTTKVVQFFIKCLQQNSIRCFESLSDIYLCILQTQYIFQGMSENQKIACNLTKTIQFFSQEQEYEEMVESILMFVDSLLKLQSAYAEIILKYNFLKVVSNLIDAWSRNCKIVAYHIIYFISESKHIKELASHTELIGKLLAHINAGQQPTFAKIFSQIYLNIIQKAYSQQLVMLFYQKKLITYLFQTVSKLSNNQTNLKKKILQNTYFLLEAIKYPLLKMENRDTQHESPTWNLFVLDLQSQTIMSFKNSIQSKNNEDLQEMICRFQIIFLQNHS